MSQLATTAFGHYWGETDLKIVVVGNLISGDDPQRYFTAVN